jgi:outer membrane scaffolding protein for murein synthesis (MipA/OmpV family)
MTHRLGRKRMLTVFPLVVVGAIFVGSATAQVAPNPESANQPVWEAGVSGFGLSSPAYPGASGRIRRGLVVPWLIYRGPVLRADGDTTGARLLKTETVEFDIGVAAAFGASSDDVEARKGMPNLGYQFEFGPRIRVNLVRPTPNSLVRLDLPLRWVFESKSGMKNRGISFEPRVSYENRDIGGGWGLAANAGVVIGDRKLNEFLYGVPVEFATPTRAAYTAKSGIITPRLQLTLSHKLGEDVRVFAFTRYDVARAGANRDSPLHLKDGGATVGLGVTWTFGRSSRMAVD